MAKLATVNIPIGDTILKQGDTIKEIDFSFAVTDTIDLTSATIRMQLYLNNSKKLDISNGNGITIIDSKNFKIDEIDYASNNLPYGVLNGDLEITDSDGVRLTYFDIIYTITKDFTK